MRAFDLSHLDGVKNQTSIAVPREPCTVMLIAHFIAVAYTVDLGRPVAAHIEHCGQRLGSVLRQIQIRRGIESRHRLEHNLLYRKRCAVSIVFHPSSHVGVQRSARWHRIKRQHLQQLSAITFTSIQPVLLRLNISQTGRLQLGRLKFKVPGEHLIASGRRRCRDRISANRTQQQRYRRQASHGGMNIFHSHTLANAPADRHLFRMPVSTKILPDH